MKLTTTLQNEDSSNNISCVDKYSFPSQNLLWSIYNLNKSVIMTIFVKSLVQPTKLYPIHLPVYIIFVCFVFIQSNRIPFFHNQIPTTLINDRTIVSYHFVY